jgi:hypothetical protein
MQALGQQLTTLEREIAHFLIFPTEQTARRTAVAAMAAGFEAVVLAPEEQAQKWSVRATHVIRASEARITEARRALTAIARAEGGDYDGWEAESDFSVMARRNRKSSRC